ncbi:MAG: HigA family addiction module antidote protein [Candidatus Eremiobacteraeota bacterium]|nr:HigA family addiction module antidote protein [Candidatus Eremiobacteraeota bacterium]
MAKRPVHPGEVLNEDVLVPLGISANKLAQALRVPANRISAIVAGRRAITADTALRLSRFLGTSPEFWLGLQTEYDLDVTRLEAARRIEREVRPRAS